MLNHSRLKAVVSHISRKTSEIWGTGVRGRSESDTRAGGGICGFPLKIQQGWAPWVPQGASAVSCSQPLWPVASSTPGADQPGSSPRWNCHAQALNGERRCGCAGEIGALQRSGQDCHGGNQREHLQSGEPRSSRRHEQKFTLPVLSLDSLKCRRRQLYLTQRSISGSVGRLPYIRMPTR